MNKRKRKPVIFCANLARKILGVAVMLFFALVALQVMLPKLIDFSTFRAEIESNLAWLTGRKIQINNLDLHVLKGIAFVCEDVAIYEEDQVTVFAKADKIYLDFKILPLFRGRIEINKIILRGPRLNLRRAETGAFNFESIFTQITQAIAANRTKTDQTNNARIHTINNLMVSIHEGSGQFIDEKILDPKLRAFDISNINLIIPDLSLNDKIPFRLSFELPHPQQPVKGRLQPQSGFMEIRGFFLTLPQEFSLEKIWLDADVRFRTSDLAPLLPYYQRFLPYRSLTGSLTVKSHFFGNLRGDFRATGSVLLRNLKLDFPKLYPSPRTVRDGRIDFALRLNAKRLEVSRFDLLLDQIKLSGQGSLDAIDDKNRTQVYFDFNIPQLAIVEGQKFYPESALPKNLPKFNQFFLGDLIGGYARDATVSFRGKIKDYKFANFRTGMDLVSFQSKVDGLRINLKSQGVDEKPLVLTSGTVALEKGSLKFIEMTGVWGDSAIHRGSGAIDHVFHDEKAVLSLWLDATLTWPHLTQFMAYDLFDILPGMAKLPGSGLLESRLFIFVPLKHPKGFTLNGEVQTKGVQFTSPLKTLEFKDINTPLEFFQNQIRVPKTLFKLGDSWVMAQIEFTDYFEPNIQALVESDDFDFKALLKERFKKKFVTEDVNPSLPDSGAGVLPQTESIKSPKHIENWTVSADINFKTGKIIEMPFENLTTKVDLKKGKLLFSRLAFAASGGMFKAESFITDFHPQRFGNFALRGEFRQFDLTQFKKGLQLTRPKMTGTLNLSGHLTSNLLSFGRLLKNLNGTFSVSGQSGEIYNLKSLANALRILNLKIFQPYQETFPFDWIHGDFIASNGLLNTKNFVIQSGLGSVSFVGDYRLSDEHINGYLGLHTFEASTRAINAIPLVGAVVAWPYKGLMNTYFLVTGPNDDPTVVLVPFRELTKGIFNLFSKIIGSQKPPPAPARPRVRPAP